MEWIGKAGIICISDAEKQSALEKKICREDKLQVIFNGVDIEAYESGEHGTVKRSSLGIPEDAYVVGMVGRISPQKAPDVFVKMAKLVKDEIPNAHFVISNNLSLNSVHQYTHQPIIQPLIISTLRSASGQGERPGSRTLRRSSMTR